MTKRKSSRYAANKALGHLVEKINASAYPAERAALIATLCFTDIAACESDFKEALRQLQDAGAVFDFSEALARITGQCDAKEST